MDNKDLQKTYDTMHQKGSSSWFSDGKEERETILKMGEPWGERSVLEIGCGEGKLAYEIFKRNGSVYAIDYSTEAFCKTIKYSGPIYACGDYRKLDKRKWNRIVMQGVLEHLDEPFTELKWMIDNLLVKGGDVITSSPCFLNPRGIVWMTLDMLGAVMSKTDLHYFNPHDFHSFCRSNGYKYDEKSCDCDWGNGIDMIEDLRQRIPLALKDGKIGYEHKRFDNFIEWLNFFRVNVRGYGATMVYRIQT